MSTHFSGPRLGFGFSEEQRAEQQQANKLKQELYAQQKKIQFSNLLERPSQDVESYIESQNNVFISSVKSSERSDKNILTSGNSEVTATVSSSLENGINYDDQDGVDFFLNNSFRSKKEPYNVSSFSEDYSTHDPAEQNHETLREHLLKQLRLDGKYSRLTPQIHNACVRIIDALDVHGFLKLESRGLSRPQLMPNAIAYPEEDEVTLRAIDEFDATFNLESTHELRNRAKIALDDYYSQGGKSRESRRAARESFDSIIGRKTTREERERAKKALDSITPPHPETNPLHVLFSLEEQETAEKALLTVQSLDPPGVGARNLRESLLLRLLPDGQYASLLKRLITNYYDDFIKKRLGSLAKKSGLSQNELIKVYSAPFPFSPSPGELFANSSVPIRTVYPEIIVEVDHSGRWRTYLDESLTNVELDPYYQKLLFSKRVDKKTRDYLRRQYVEAQALIDALRNRNSTLLRVARAVVDFQEQFFSNPKESPKPLTQQQIADKLGLDASTVSRACNDKWLSTPRGYVSFKELFPKAVTGETTSQIVADKIRSLIENESHSSPLSDEDIACALKRDYSIEVSRKTVQEHRDQLHIPNSRVRKRLKAQHINN